MNQRFPRQACWARRGGCRRAGVSGGCDTKSRAGDRFFFLLGSSGSSRLLTFPWSWRGPHVKLKSFAPGPSSVLNARQCMQVLSSLVLGGAARSCLPLHHLRGACPLETPAGCLPGVFHASRVSYGFPSVGALLLPSALRNDTVLGASNCL